MLLGSGEMVLLLRRFILSTFKSELSLAIRGSGVGGEELIMQRAGELDDGHMKIMIWC